MRLETRTGWRRCFGAAVLLVAIAALWGCGQQQQQAVAEKEKTEILGAGTEILAALQNTVDTGKNHVGDKITLRTLEDVRVNEMTVVPAGASSPFGNGLAVFAT